MNNINFKDLETKGYVIIKNFLDSIIIEDIKKDYIIAKENFLKTYDANKKHNIIRCLYRLDHLIKDIVSSIVEQTNLNLGNPSLSGGYFDNQITNFTWHQDHEPYFKYRDSYNAINCWIPIIKENENESGISLIPHDMFEEKFSEIYKTRIHGQGAKSFVVKNSITTMRDDDKNVSVVLPFDLNSISVTPKLIEGDMLIMRQDLIHQTQEAITKRVAVSVRCYAKDCQPTYNTDFYRWLKK
jgi:hypothetical protein